MRTVITVVRLALAALAIHAGLSLAAQVEQKMLDRNAVLISIGR